MRKAVNEFTVIRNQELNSGMHLLLMEAAEPLLPIFAGQFANIEIPDNGLVFLRRPFSILDADHQTNQISVLVKIAGKGSLFLSRAPAGQKLNLVYPLGRGFTLPLPDEQILAVAGGSGLAPLLFLVRKAALKENKIQFLIGAGKKNDLFPVDEYTGSAEFYFTTEDGSWGEKGFVTEHPLFGNLDQFDRIYTCGPLPMMKEVARLAFLHQISCEVSLENLMACGFGVCLCCIEPTVKGNLCVCTEGPVFNTTDLKW
jgi:dihydroorotate dehydrogenase electron transfer subunit